MKTQFSLKDLFEVYHEKCRELEQVHRIKDLLTDQNEKLIKSNFESEKVKELKTEIAVLQAHIDEQEDYKDELVKIWQDSQDKLIEELRKSKARVRELEEWINLPGRLNVPSNDSNRFEKWDDFNTGG